MNEQLRAFVIAVMEDIGSVSGETTPDTSSEPTLSMMLELGKSIGLLQASSIIHKHYKQMKGEDE